MKDAVEQARSQDGEPGVTPAVPGDRDGAGERPDPQRPVREHAVAVAGKRLEQRLAAEPAVERQEVAAHDVQEGGQRADRGEPDDHERAWQPEAERGDRETGDALAGRTPPREPHDERDQERGVGLDPHPDAERAGRQPESPPAGTHGIGERGPRESRQRQAEQQVPLSGPPGSPGQVVEAEQRRGRRRATPAERAEGGNQPGGRAGEDRQVEGPEGAVTASERDQCQRVGEVDTGPVHVEDVAVRRRPVQETGRHVVHEGAVVDHGPGEGADRQVGGQAAGQGHGRPG